MSGTVHTNSDPRPLWRQPLELTLCAILVAIVAITFAQVIYRYVLQAPLSWSEEAARFLLM